MKLVQTALASSPSIISRFEPDSQKAARLASTFARQTVLSNDFPFADSGVIVHMVAECRRHPEKFVLKPQREGGGNNIFGGKLIFFISARVSIKT